MFNKIKQIFVNKYCNELSNKNNELEIENKQLIEENKQLAEENNDLKFSNADLRRQLDSALDIIYSNRKRIRALLGQLDEFGG